jgi:GWxTD domain-containing protein
MNFSKIIYGFILVNLVFVFACTSEKVNQSSTDRLYKKENNELTAKYLVYHINDSISQLFYEISNEALIYKKSDTSNYYYSNVKVFLKASAEDNLNASIDTASVYIKDKQTDAIVKQLAGSVIFKIKTGFNYYLDVNVFDVNKKTQYSHNLFINKTTKDSRQNFLITNWRNEILFTSYYKPQDVVYIQSSRNQEKLYMVDYFKPNFKLALPPFSMEPRARFTYKPDSVFSVYASNDKIEMSLPSTGFFHLKTNEETKDGVTFFVYESSYPKIKNTEQMILATRYIMAKKEFDNCLLASDKKAAIDKFWLDLGGSNERAKELIKKYYGRVQEANKTFTSYQEGWKTDRGMIYIVFGAPNHVTKRKNGEIWTFGEIGNPNSTVFTFVKVINPFTDNDYYLERGEVFKAPWYQAVDMWRQGRVYLDN